MFLLKEERSDHSNAFLLKEELSDPLYPPLFPSSLYIKIGKKLNRLRAGFLVEGIARQTGEEQSEPLRYWVRFPG